MRAFFPQFVAKRSNVFINGVKNACPDKLDDLSVSFMNSLVKDDADLDAAIKIYDKMVAFSVDTP